PPSPPFPYPTLFRSPLLLDAVLQRQGQVLLDQRFVRLADEAGREPHQDLVLDERVAELHEHLPSRAALAEVLRAMRRGVEVEPRSEEHTSELQSREN